MNNLQQVYTVTKIQECSEKIYYFEQKHNLCIFLTGISSVATVAGLYLNEFNPVNEITFCLSMGGALLTTFFGSCTNAYSNRIYKEKAKRDFLDIMLKMDELGGNAKVKK